MRGKGYHMDWVNQGFNLNAVIREMDGLIRDGHIHFGDNDLMKVHLLETTLVRDTKKDLFMIGKINENKHIDGVAAFLDAMTVRQKNWANSGQQLRNDGYEQLGKEVDDGTI
jgi:phage terminase large subunit-like protein